MKIVNKKTHRPTPQDVYCGRPGPYGNPFQMRNQSDAERDRVCDAFDNMLGKLEDDHEFHVCVLRDRIATIPADANLVCFCAPKRCHCETIVRVWKEYNS